jgi:hypothetical protein
MIKTGYTIIFILLALIFLLIISEEEFRRIESQRVLCQSVSKSHGCKTDSCRHTKINKDKCKIEFYYLSKSKTLILNQNNTTIRCRPDQIDFAISLNNDTVNITEKENSYTAAQADSYDLGIEITGVQQQEYKINLKRAGAIDQKCICFPINLSDSIHGIYTIE